MSQEQETYALQWQQMSPEKKAYILQLALITITQVVDVVTTAIGLEYGAMEGNPLMREVMARGGMEAFAQIKIVASIGIIALFELFRIVESKKNLGDWYIEKVLIPNRLLNILMVGIAINNTIILQSLQ